MPANARPSLLILLEEERLALLSGNLEGALALGPAKESAIHRLADIPQAELSALHRAAQRNAGLLKAALSGLSSMQGRSTALGQTSGNFSHYQADGSNHLHSTLAGGVLERRA